jgi:hypothetical protein
LRRAVGDDIEPDTTGITTASPLFLPLFRLLVANLHGGDDERLMVNATALAASGAADIGFVDFDVLADRAADLIAVGANHSSPQLVEDLEGGFVSAKAKLPLELDRRHAGREAGREVSSPKPNRQWRVRPLHDGPGSQGIVLAALAAPQDVRASIEPERLAAFAAPLTDKPVAPADRFEICRTGGVIGKQPLEFRERARKRKIVAGKGRHRSTLPALLRQYPLDLGGACPPSREGYDRRVCQPDRAGDFLKTSNPHVGRNRPLVPLDPQSPMTRNYQPSSSDNPAPA